MITKETLEKLRRKHSVYKYESPMFIDGKFNPDNCNGGDNLIRDYFYEIELNGDWQKCYGLNDGYLIVDFHYCSFLDQSYAVIIHDNGEYHDIYYFSWYKHLCQTEVAKFNGRDMTEEEYIRLLNMIEETGYRFKIN